MTTRDQVLNEAPAGLTADILAAHLQRANVMLDSADAAGAREVADGVLTMLTGSDDARVRSTGTTSKRWTAGTAVSRW